MLFYVMGHHRDLTLTHLVCLDLLDQVPYLIRNFSAVVMTEYRYIIRGGGVPTSTRENLYLGIS